VGSDRRGVAGAAMVPPAASRPHPSPGDATEMALTTPRPRQIAARISRRQSGLGAQMRAGSWFLRIFCKLPACCLVLCTGCSALIAYSGANVEKLANRDEVHKAFAAPDRSADGYDEYHTWRKVSEPQVAGVDLLLGMETLGVLELWNFPSTTLECAFTALVGQDLPIDDRKCTSRGRA
jgi:hypothetical protein